MYRLRYDASQSLQSLRISSLELVHAFSTEEKRHWIPGFCVIPTQGPFRVPLFPWPLFIFGTGCVWPIRSAIQFKPYAAAICFAIIFHNVPRQQYGLDPRSRERLGPVEIDATQSNLVEKYLS